MSTPASLINDATGARRGAVTNEVGLYTFNAVQPGAYTVQVEQSGFKTFRRTKIELTANESRAIDIKLDVGATAETVQVVAQGATVNTASGERAGVVTAAQLDTLQLKGRDYMGTVRLLPGVVDTKNRDAPGFGTNSGIYIQGGRGDSTNITLDGVTSLVPAFMITLMVAPALRPEFHGSAYEYRRNEALNANNFFNNLTGLPRARYRYDIFRYTVFSAFPDPAKCPPR